MQDGIGEGDEGQLLHGFHHVCAVFSQLPALDRGIVSDICERMGAGMAEYCGRDLREGTIDSADYNRYCFYVVSTRLGREM